MFSQRNFKSIVPVRQLYYFQNRMKRQQHIVMEGHGILGFEPEEFVTYEDLGKLHVELFAFYSQVQAYELNEQETIQIKPLMRSSRSIGNATKNLYEF